MQTGPMADSLYKPYLFKNMSPSLRSVSMGLLEDDSNAVPLDGTEVKPTRVQLAVAYRDEALKAKEDAETNLQPWIDSISSVDVTAVGKAMGGGVQTIVGQAQSYVQGVEEDAENKLEEVKSAVISAMDLGSTIAAASEYMPLLGPSMSFAKAAVRLVQAIRATRAIEFTSARDTGTGVERARINARLSTLSSCRMLQLLQTQLEAQVQLSSDAEALKNVDLLGLPASLVALMPESAKLSLGRTLTATLCAVLNPVHHRINAVFRTYGVCGGGAVSQPPYSSHSRKVAALLSHEMRTGDAAALAASKRHAYMPHVDTCHDDDIYDAVLTTSEHEAAWKTWGYLPLTFSSARSLAPAAAAEFNGVVSEDSNGAYTFGRSSTGGFLTDKRDDSAFPSRVVMYLSCKELKLQKVASASNAAKLAFLSRLQVPLTDFRVVSRGRKGENSVDVAGAEEEGLITSGLRPLLLAGAPAATAELSNAKRFRGYSAPFPKPNPAAETQPLLLPAEVQDADLRKGRQADRWAFYIYVARGGPAVITAMSFVPFIETDKVQRQANAALPWQVSPNAGAPFATLAKTGADATLATALAGVDADTKHVLTSAATISISGKVDGSLVSISKAVTYESLAGPATYKVKDLGVPAGFNCAVQTTPAWAWYTCPGSPPNCAKLPTASEEELTGDMSRFTRFKRFARGIKTGRPDGNEGMVVHSFESVCPASALMSSVQVLDDSLAHKGYPRNAWIPTRSWERVVPSPWDDEKDNTDRVKLATLPYVWLQRRYAGPALQARDPLSCAPAPADALLPAMAIRRMSEGTCYVPSSRK